MQHHISVDPSVIVQSSLALVMAITMTDAIKASVEHVNVIYPGIGLFSRIVAMLVVVIIIMSFALYVSKHRHVTARPSNASPAAQPDEHVTPN